MIYKVIMLFGILVIFLSGCATFPQSKAPIQESNLSVGAVKMKIIKGKTNQAEILKWFGSPNLVTKDRSNNEVWEYNRMSFETKSGADAGWLVLWSGNRVMSTATTKSFDLIIVFSSNDIVKNYSVIYSSY